MKIPRTTILFVLALLSVLNAAWSSAEDLITADKALKKIYSQATGFERKEITLSAEEIARVEQKARMTFAGAHSDKVVVYAVQQAGQTVSYAFEDIVIGKWGPIHYLVGLDPQGGVQEAVVLDYQEIRGKPIAKRRFLRQYDGKGPGDTLQLHKDIDGISGATISSRSFTEGIRKILHIYKEIKGRL